MASRHWTVNFSSSVHTPQRPTVFLHGVGNVPSGPRGYRQPNRPVQYPDYYRPAYSRTFRNEFEDSQTTIKEEETDTDVNLHVDTNANPSLEPGEITETNESTGTSESLDAMKRESTVDTEEIQPHDSGYQFAIGRLMAQHARSTRSDSSGSVRQDTREGTRQRTDSALSYDSRDRSRSPQRSSDSGDLTRSRYAASRYGSPLFVPDRQESTDTTGFEGDGTISVHGVQSKSGSNSPPTGSTTEEEEEDSRCRCPIGYMCRVRHSDDLDCRPLVWEYPTWHERDQEWFERHRGIAEGGQENLTTATDLRRIIQLTHDFMNGPSAGCRTISKHIRDWVIDMEDVSVTIGIQQTVTTQNVIPALTTFLDPLQERVRRLRGLPEHLEEELLVLQRKWTRGDFCGYTKRGLKVMEVSDVNGIYKYKRERVDTSWQFHVSGLYFGVGGLVNGQIWGSRVELQRDGAHAPTQAGISGTSEHGARSVLLGAFDERRNLGYADTDMGNVIEYVGTAMPDQIPSLGPTNVKDIHMGIPGAWDPTTAMDAKRTHGTRALFKSIETGTPVRVIRSWKMCSIVSNKPHKGYRYDGLYRVVRATAMKEARQIWSFRMHRLEDQMSAHGPLRGFARTEPKRRSNGKRLGHFCKQ